MAAVRARTVLLTGSNRGIGLELVKQLLGTPRPPAWIFATCRDPEGPRAQVGAGRGVVVVGWWGCRQHPWVPADAINTGWVGFVHVKKKASRMQGTSCSHSVLPGVEVG